MGMDAGSSTTRGRGKRGQGKKRRAAPSMNVTPLVDVVLVLLIIFMVVTPMLAKQFWVHMPDQDKEDTEPPTPDSLGPIVVSVADDGAIRINQQVVDTDDFSQKLRRILAARKTRTIFFDSSDGAPFGRAMEVMDLARNGGAATIAVATSKLPSSP